MAGYGSDRDAAALRFWQKRENCSCLIVLLVVTKKHLLIGFCALRL